jgi:hypothetical protein
MPSSTNAASLMPILVESQRLYSEEQRLIAWQYLMTGPEVKGLTAHALENATNLYRKCAALPLAHRACDYADTCDSTVLAEGDRRAQGQRDLEAAVQDATRLGDNKFFVSMHILYHGTVRPFVAPRTLNLDAVSNHLQQQVAVISSLAATSVSNQLTATEVSEKCSIGPVAQKLLDGNNRPVKGL